MRIRHAALIVLAAIAVAVATPPLTARQSDVVLSQRLPPVCNPQSATPYLYYNVSDGRWHCTASAPLIYNASTATTTITELNRLHDVTPGTVAASKYVAVDANGAINILRTASLRIGTSGSETTVTTTGAEMNKLAGVTAGTITASKNVLVDANKAVDTLRATTDRTLGGTGVPGAAVVQQEFTKTVTGIADATATDVLTITVPNAAHLAQIQVCVTGVMGAGGAIGAGEAAATNCYNVTLVRTAGVNAVATASSAFGAAAANVAGAGTVTATAAMSVVAGAVGASNSFTVKATITKSGGSSANHVAFITVRLLNGNASGITIS